MELKDIVKQRYATKQFDGKVIPQGKIDELLEIIRFAPSALNLQPWKIRIVTDLKDKKALLPATRSQGQVKTCSHLLVFCANTKKEDIIENINRLMKEEGTPEDLCTMRINMANGMFGKMSPRDKVEWVKCNVFLALGNAVNGAKSLGLDSCPMTGFDSAEYSRILKLPEHLVPTILCALGYGADKPIPKMRYSKEEILI